MIGDEVSFDFINIDRSMGESRLAQIMGIILACELLWFMLSSKTVIPFYKNLLGI